jgi:hypothetical protein
VGKTLTEKQSEHGFPHIAKDSNGINLRREFEILLDNADDAKIMSKQPLAGRQQRETAAAGK